MKANTYIVTVGTEVCGEDKYPRYTVALHQEFTEPMELSIFLEKILPSLNSDYAVRIVKLVEDKA